MDAERAALYRLPPGGQQPLDAAAIRREITQVYQQHNPAKLGQLDALLQEWEGREDELLRQVRSKYTTQEPAPAPMPVQAQVVSATPWQQQDLSKDHVHVGGGSAHGGASPFDVVGERPRYMPPANPLVRGSQLPVVAAMVVARPADEYENFGAPAGDDGLRELNSLHQPGFETWSPSANTGLGGRHRPSTGLKAFYCHNKLRSGAVRCCVAFVVGALLCGLVIALVASGGEDSGEGSAMITPVSTSVAVEDDEAMTACPTPQIAHGTLAVDADLSQFGLPTDGTFHAGHAARVSCDPGFVRGEGATLLICRSSQSGSPGWSVDLDSFPRCELPAQPPPPPPVVVPVSTYVYTEGQLEAAAEDVSTALATAASDPNGAAAEDVVDIASSVTFPVALEEIAEGSIERRTFEQGFVDSMAESLGGISRDAILIRGIFGGSIVVDWVLVAPASVAEQAASLVTTLAASGTAIEVVIGGQRIEADTRSIAQPLVTRAPDVDCEGAWTTCLESCEDKLFAITVTASGAGRPCDHTHGSAAQCSPGDGECRDTTVAPRAEWCSQSPEQTCRVRCPEPVCPSGQCAMRHGQCCDIHCQLPANPEQEPAPPSPPPPPPPPAPPGDVIDTAVCAALCADEGHCCEDHEVGSNQLISCSQACHIREQGTDHETCRELCDERAESRGCSTTVNGIVYNHCQRCSDLHDGCPHGVQDVQSCYRGCELAGGGGGGGSAPPMGTDLVFTAGEWVGRRCIYELHSNELSAHEALQVCASNGGSLASIHDASTLSNITALIDEAGVGSSWIGLHDQHLESRCDSTGFVWHDHTPTDYENWAPNEPNNHANGQANCPTGTSTEDEMLDGNEDCVEMYRADGWNYGQWNDLACDARRPYICERDCGDYIQSVINLDQLPGVVVTAGPGVNDRGNPAALIDMNHEPDEWTISPTADLADCSTNVYMTVDLGAIYETVGVTIWHYYGNDRAYCNQKLAISTTGHFSGEEVVIFDTGACSGWCPFPLDANTCTGDCTPTNYEDTESAGGNSFVWRSTPARYVRHWSGRGQNAGVHFMEIDVYGPGDVDVVAPPAPPPPAPPPAPSPEQDHSCLSRVAMIDYESVAAIDMVMIEYHDGSETAVHDPDASGPHDAAYARHVDTEIPCDLYILRVWWVSFVNHGWMGRELHYQLADASGHVQRTIEQRAGYAVDCLDDDWAQDSRGGCVVGADFSAPEGSAIVNLIWSSDGRLTNVQTEPLPVNGLSSLVWTLGGGELGASHDQAMNTGSCDTVCAALSEGMECVQSELDALTGAADSVVLDRYMQAGFSCSQGLSIHCERDDPTDSLCVSWGAPYIHTTHVEEGRCWGGSPSAGCDVVPVDGHHRRLCPCGVSSPAPPPAPQLCTMGGGECGGQVWFDCGTACPTVCGEDPSPMCNRMCVAAYQCTIGLLWDSLVGECVAATECSDPLIYNGTGGTLPPGIAVGRPFLDLRQQPAIGAAAAATVSAAAVPMVSDWECEV